MQTPLATLHKFDGWADLFLTTPNKGLQDLYAGAAYRFDGVKALPGLKMATFFQIERSLTAVIDLQLTAQLPLLQSQADRPPV